MINVSIVLFAVAALGGLTLAMMRFRNRPLPMSLALIHGLVAAIALVLLLIVALGPAGTSFAKLSLIIFVAAALGGFYLFSRHIRKQQLPIPVVLIHGVVAVIAFATLLYGVYGR